VILHPETTPSPTSEIPGPDLFMTVVKVAGWPRALEWYVGTLGLLAVLIDHEHQFALLAAGNGRLALQGDPEREPACSVRLVFLVPDVDAEYRRLNDLGIEVSPPVENTREGYRETRLHDPEGTALTLFSWTGPPRGQLSGHPPE
jgi:hypothetical protein